MQAEELLEQTMASEESDICERCGNVYRIIWLKEGDDFNDFGIRHCPFCGMLMNEF